MNTLAQTFGWLASLYLIYFLLAAFSDAATPTEPELPRWQFGKPQQIENTLFP